VVFEQRLNVGGVWNATPAIKQDGNFHVPQTRPIPVPGNPLSVSKGENGKMFQFLSPIYDDLDTNIPHTLMNYSDLPFPNGTPLFPHHTIVLKYLERYADDIRHLIQLGVQVLDVRPSTAKGRDKWLIMTRNLKTKEEKTEAFDAVIVSNGHYEDPFVPTITGIKEWNTAYPGTISHSKFYRRPDEYRDKVRTLGESSVYYSPLS
jgi:cation diffusion facilitator CzcD-associated flavoprotein CzcO